MHARGNSNFYHARQFGIAGVLLSGGGYVVGSLVGFFSSSVPHSDTSQLVHPAGYGYMWLGGVFGSLLFLICFCYLLSGIIETLWIRSKGRNSSEQAAGRQRKSVSAFDQFETFILTRDLNTVIVRGMTGCILEIYNDGEAYEVEFVKNDGTNFEYEGSFTFTVTSEVMRKTE